MKQRGWRLVICGFVAGALVFGGLARLRPVQPVNILLITLDTTRADRIGCYGYEAADTPRLDALAKRGVLFERAYAPAPITLPSHASMLTGLWPAEHGVITNGQNALEPGIPTIAVLLSQGGFANAAFLAAFVVNRKFGLDRGFATYDDDLSTAAFNVDELHRYRDGRFVVDSAVKWLTNHCPHNHKTPFFCWVHFYDPHEPYREHQDEFGDRYSDRLYDGEIAYTDQLIGRLLDTLDKLGVAENTYVMIVGDHGEGLGEHGEQTHGYMLHDSTLHVPLIVFDPRCRVSGLRISTPVPLLDVFPTLLEAGGVRIPEGTSGRSLQPALSGASLEPRVCYSQTDEPFLQAFWSPLQGLTTDRWRYVRSTKPELYDLSADPQELNNLAATRLEKVSALEEQLSEFESKLRRRSGQEVTMSAAERRALESLGYTGGQSGRPASPHGDQPLADIKDMIESLNRLNESVALIDAQKFDEAAVLLEPLARDVPNFLRARLNLGLCRMMQKNYDDAAHWLNLALELDPNSERAHDMLGYAYLKLRKLDLAELHVGRLLELRPNSENGYLFLGEIHQRRGNYPLAMQNYETVLQINPRNALARQTLHALRAAAANP